MNAATNALRPYLTYPAWGAMATVLLVCLLLPAPTVAKIAPYPFAFSIVFLGLPHGAWDTHIVPAVRKTPGSLAYLSAFCTAYIGAMLVYAAVFFAVPGFAFALFVALSWAHWGQGDAAHGREAFPGYRAAPAWLVWLVRGGAAIALPALRFPETLSRIARGVVSLFAPVGAGDFAPPQSAANAALIALAVAVAVYVWLALRQWRFHRVAVIHDIGEIALLYTVFALSDPVLAVGVYFCFWHGLRHIGRLLLLDGTSRALCEKGRVSAAFARFAWQCLPILLASLLLLFTLYGAVSQRSLPDAALSVYLALIACLTFPHFLLVCWLDAASPGAHGNMPPAP